MIFGIGTDIVTATWESSPCRRCSSARRRWRWGGPAATIGGNVVSMASAGLVVSSQTIALQAPASIRLTDYAAVVALPGGGAGDDAGEASAVTSYALPATRGGDGGAGRRHDCRHPVRQLASTASSTTVGDVVVDGTRTPSSLADAPGGDAGRVLLLGAASSSSPGGGAGDPAAAAAASTASRPPQALKTPTCRRRARGAAQKQAEGKEGSSSSTNARRRLADGAPGAKSTRDTQQAPAQAQTGRGGLRQRGRARRSRRWWGSYVLLLQW